LKSILNNKFRERILRALLDIAILARLENKAMNGYELTVFFLKKNDAAISTSTVYSTLYAMERNELVKGRYNRRSRVYELTEKGKKTLKDTRNNLESLQTFMKTLLK
jgi:DNA-binding PadR family transcriptional regulator